MYMSLKQNGDKHLAIDIETYSSVDLRKSGVYPYAESDDFEILLFAYAWDNEPVECIDLAQGETLPAEVLGALIDERITKTAFNANFERTCIASHFGLEAEPKQWKCTAVHALTLGLPGYLDGVAKAMKIEEQKDAAGTNLINFFSKPCKPTKANGGRTRNLPKHDLERWQEYKDYNIQDVVVERAIKQKLDRYQPTEFEQKLWQLDQKIIDTGVYLDDVLVAKAILCDTKAGEKAMQEAKKITGLDNPNSTAQLRKWMEEQGESIPNLQAATVAQHIKDTDNKQVKRVLELRQAMSKTSVSKYAAMDNARCSDNRVRGLLQFYGANRTGRWAGRLVQVQNLPRNEMQYSDLDAARTLLKNGDFETMELLYERVPDVLSQLIRTALVPAPGHRLIVSDFSAIEARVIAWFAGEQWRLDVFNSHGKIYEASAAQMFNVPIESITRENGLRDKGKIAELALGYQGAVGAMKQMGAEGMGMSEEEMQEIVYNWRTANSKIKQFWYDVGGSALKAVREREVVNMQHGLQFSYESGIMFIRLPSGRRLAYKQPSIEKNKFDRDAIHFDGAKTRESTYGGKLVENIVQATARDLLAESLIKVDKQGYKIVFHVHDEIVVEAEHGVGSLAELEGIMSEPVDWAPGLPLNADGFETNYYMKD